MKLARRMSRVRWNVCNGTSARSIMLRNDGAAQRHHYGAEACALMDSIGSPEAEQFDTIRREKGMAAALKWRAEQFAPYE